MLGDSFIFQQELLYETNYYNGKSQKDSKDLLQKSI